MYIDTFAMGLGVSSPFFSFILAIYRWGGYEYWSAEEIVSKKNWLVKNVS